MGGGGGVAGASFFGLVQSRLNTASHPVSPQPAIPCRPSLPWDDSVTAVVRCRISLVCSLLRSGTGTFFGLGSFFGLSNLEPSADVLVDVVNLRDHDKARIRARCKPRYTSARMPPSGGGARRGSCASGKLKTQRELRSRAAHGQTQVRRRSKRAPRTARCSRRFRSVTRTVCRSLHGESELGCVGAGWSVGGQHLGEGGLGKGLGCGSVERRSAAMNEWVAAERTGPFGSKGHAGGSIGEA